ncbi:MAG: sigma 54-interacting transcriptional regulator [Spirochaetia bacterium]|nr:sigma 54-interacting transcriptional regulator [Spirochaetales bacterium]MDX9784164.1 sigma 54-interacting transcriptional regulator [Spirochaetia bacterium]
MIPWLHSTMTIDTEKEHELSGEDSILAFDKHPIIKALIESVSTGVLVLDKNGNVVHINKIGAQILGQDQAQAQGKHVTKIVDFRPVILDVLESGRGYLEKEVLIQSPSRGRLRFIKSAIVIKDKRSRLVGVIDTFRLVETMNRIHPKVGKAKARYSFSDIIGNQPVFLEAINLSRVAAQSDAPVLIEGESGTGKEMFAHAIHQASARASGPLVIVNCSSLPHTLIESELFGYESGSFTGARKEGYQGKFEQADGGTIVLDEIGEMPQDMQAKLLRVLQDLSFTRIGGTKTITVDTRVIASTNKKLREEIQKGSFREDLYYRLNVLRIQPPPLRERLDDIPLLVSHFVTKNALHHGRVIPEVEKAVVAAFQEYQWPGNVRELENVIERAILISRDNRITMRELPDYIYTSIQGKLQEKNPPRAEPEPEPEPEPLNLESAERRQVAKALKEAEGNISACAKLLGISRNTLYRKMKQYSL